MEIPDNVDPTTSHTDVPESLTTAAQHVNFETNVGTHVGLTSIPNIESLSAGTLTDNDKLLLEQIKGLDAQNAGLQEQINNNMKFRSTLVSFLSSQKGGD